MKKKQIFSHSYNLQQPSPAQSIEHLLNSAVQYHQKGELQIAEQQYNKVLELQPRHDYALNLLGILISQSRNDHRQAEKYLKKAIKINPEIPDYYSNLGLCLQQQKKFTEAEKEFKKAVKINPNFINAWFGLGNINTYLKNPQLAIKNYKKAIECNHEFLPAYNNLGNVYRELREYDEALTMFEKAVELKPDFAEAWYNMGLVYRFIPDAEKAIQAFDKAIQLKNNYARAYSKKGFCYYKLLDDHDHAMQSFDQSIAIDPAYVYPYLYKSVIYQELGQFDKAEEILIKVLQIDESSIGAYLGLANARSIDSFDERKLQEFLDEEDIGNRKKVSILFTLGKIFNDKKEYDKAFNYYDSGNRLFRSTYQYEMNDLVNEFNKIREVFTKSLIEEISPFGSTSKVPVFIVGMPRSGTTLTEQIIASHPDVFGGGERTFLQDSVNEISKQLGIDDSFPSNITQFPKSEFSRLADSYLTKIQSLDGAGGANRITDKLPHNFLLLGLIETVFPGATIIHCQRNPVDTCLSIYFQHFEGIHPYAYDLCELGNYYKLYQGLMSFWEDQLPGQVYTVEYEKLIQEPEKTSRNLIEHVGLQWDENCLKFYETERFVKTASQWQVRQPIYQSSTEVRQNYQGHIKEL